VIRYCDQRLWDIMISVYDEAVISYWSVTVIGQWSVTVISLRQAVIRDCDQRLWSACVRLWSETVIRGWLGFDQAVIRGCDDDLIQLHETFPYTPPAVCKHLHILHSCEEHIHALNASIKSSHAHFILLGGLDPFPHLVTMWIFCN
jgi:hypothetical protein